MRCGRGFVILSSLSLNWDSPWTRNITIRQKKDKPISLFCIKFPQRQKSAENLKRFWNRSIHLFHHKLRSIVKTFRFPRLLLHKWPWPGSHVYVPVAPATLWFFGRCQKKFWPLLNGFPPIFLKTPLNFTKVCLIVVDHKANLFY